MLNLLEICNARVCNVRFESHSVYDCDYSFLICCTVSSGKKYQLTQCHILEHLSLNATCSQ